MQRNVIYCDACQAPDLEPGYSVLAVSGDRSTAIKSRITGGRNTLDLCDVCASSLGEFLAELGRPRVETSAPFAVAEAVASPEPTEDEDR